ncbi:hypothetical protein ACHAO9_004775 [Fusarium lateritium]
MVRNPTLNTAKESRMSSSTSPPAPATDRRRSRMPQMSASSASPISNAMQIHDEEDHSEMEAPTFKSEQANKLSQRINWLDRQWGGSSWLPEDVRRSQPSSLPIAGATVKYLVKITKIAQRENVALASLWDYDSQYNFLRQAVNKGNNPPRLLSNMAAQVYKDWNGMTGELGASDHVSDHEPGLDSEDDNAKSKQEVPDSDSESDVGEKTKATAAFPTSVKRPNPPTFSHQSSPSKKSNLLAKRSAVMPVSTRPAPATAGSSYTSEQGQLSQLSSKRKNDDESPIDAPTPKRAELSKQPVREDQVQTKAAALLKQLLEDERLTSDSLETLSKVLVAPHHLMKEGKANLIDPLWFKLSNKNVPERTKKFDRSSMVCFPIHHPAPKHWTLAVVYITADSMVLRHHDSLPSPEGEHYKAVCMRFKEWKEHHGFQHALSFERIETCARQRDVVNCGIHVLSCLRYELAGGRCPEFLSPPRERELLIQCMEVVDDNAITLSDTDHAIVREFNKLMGAQKKRVKTEEHNKIWAEIGETTIEALVAQGEDAEAQQALILADLSQAQQAMDRLVIEHDVLVVAINNVTQAVDSEGVTSNPIHLDTLSKQAGISQKELIANQSRAFGDLLASTFCRASDIFKGTLQHQINGIAERLREAREEVWRKKMELGKAEGLVKMIAHKREAKEAVMKMMQQAQDGLFSN